MAKPIPPSKKSTGLRNVIVIRLYAANMRAQDQDMIRRWNLIAKECSLNLDVGFVNLIENPELTDRLDIVSTPTTIVSLPGKPLFRFLGYSDNVDELLFSFGVKNRARSTAASASEMSTFATQMGAEANQMSIEAQKMIEKSREQLAKVKNRKF
ncbi:hypothetical protein V5T82_16570 [Magnetovibrio sp. PR-2]|uniref:hypothetical protein n=1 Tax=Magnetovibrio sp. PR-2 TaxID=3120356 RepID=UPI002FCE02C7